MLPFVPFDSRITEQEFVSGIEQRGPREYGGRYELTKAQCGLPCTRWNADTEVLYPAAGSNAAVDVSQGHLIQLSKQVTCLIATVYLYICLLAILAIRTFPQSFILVSDGLVACRLGAPE